MNPRLSPQRKKSFSNTRRKNTGRGFRQHVQSLIPTFHEGKTWHSPWFLTIGMVVSLGLFVLVAVSNRSLLAATYTWTQTNWTGGGETATADSFERATLGSSWSTRAGSPTIANASDYGGLAADHNLSIPSTGGLTANQWVEATIATMSSGHEVQVCARVTDSGNVNGYCLATDGTFANIYRLTNLGWGGDIANAVSFPVAGDTIRLEVEGTAIRGYRNNTLFMSGTDATYATGSPAISTWASGVPTARIEAVAYGDLPFANTTTASHPANQNNWTQYATKDSTTTATTTVSLAPVTQSHTQTTDTDFSSGTLSGTVLTGTGTAGRVELTQSEGSTPIESTYTGSTIPFLTLDTDGNMWGVTNGSPYSIHKITPEMSGTSFSNTCASGNAPAGLAYDPITPAIWVTNATDRRVCRFNPNTGAELSETTIGGAGNLGRLAYDPVNQSMWAVNYTYGYLYRLDLSANVLNTYDLPTLTGLSGGGYNLLVYEPTTASLFSVVYDGDTDSNSIVKVVAGTGTTTSTPISTVGTGLAMMTAVPTVPAVWILDPTWGSYRINANTLAANVFNPGTGPTTIAYDSAHDVVWTTHGSQPYLKKWSTAGASLDTYNTTNRGSAFDAQYDASRKRLWSARGSAGTGIWSVSFVSYGSSGTFTSTVLDSGNHSSYGAADWTASTSGNTSVTVKARTSTSPTMVGAPAFGTCTALVDGADISANGCVTDTHRYIQFEATLATTNVAETPSLQDIRLDYTLYTSGTLTSSPYDGGDATNIVAGIAWTTSGTGSSSFQIRTSADGVAWTAWLGPTGSGDQYTDPSGAQTIHAQHRDSSNDRYVQYRVTLGSVDGINAPSLTGVTLTYVVNAPPEFQASPTATQLADGTVPIQYTIRSPDTDTDTGSVGFVTPSFEYSLNNGTDWDPISAGLSTGATDPKAVDDVDYTTYTATWTPTALVDGAYSTEVLVRVTINDQQAANNVATSTSAIFTLDTKDPTLGSPAITVDATTIPATLGLSASDDSSLEMCVTLDNTASNCIAYSAATTITLATDPDTVYVIYRDAVGNTSTANAVTPAKPANLVIRDISNVVIGEYQLFLTWGATSIPAPQFSEYRVYHSTDGVSYSQIATIADRAINYYFHQGLDAGSQHWYKVSVVTTAGNVSSQSAAIEGTANGQGGGTDTVAPSISSVTATSITTQSAVLSWETDEISDSSIGYSTTPADFSTVEGVATMADTATGLGRHQVVLVNLQPDTTYYYRVMSSDPSGNEGSDTNGGDGYSFHTLAGPTITNVTTTSVDNNSATITWKTNIPADSTIRYSTTIPFTTPFSVTSEEEVIDHAIELTNLVRGTTYYFEVASSVALDPNGGAYYSFTTTDDSTPPIIGEITVDPIIDTQAVIRWSTNERATSSVELGISSGDYTSSSPADDSLNLLHAVSLTGLAPLTTYYFVVHSVDSSGNPATSAEQSFTTTDTLVTEAEARAREEAARGNTDRTAPTVAAVNVTNITSSAATVSWSTNEAANAFVRFGVTDATSLVYGNWVYESDHEITLQYLTPRTAYSFTIISADAAGNIIESAPGTFTTATASVSELEELIVDTIETYSGDIPTPIISGQPKVEVAATRATINWTTDKAANSLVGYAPDGLYQAGGQKYVQFVGDPETYVTDHVVAIENLTPDTLYHFQVRSKTVASNPSASPDYTFRTEKRSFAIENYSVDQIDDETAAFRWTTTEPGTSTVTIVPYRNNVRALDELRTVTETEQTIIHQIQIDSLEPSVRYQVELISTNAVGARTSNVIDTFSTVTTPEPPFITRLQVDSALSTGENIKVQTIVSWTTDKPSTSQVRWREGVGQATDELPNQTPLDGAYTKRHLVVLTSFKPGSVYQLRVESSDSNGQVTLSKPLTILTPQQEQTVFEVIMGAINQAFGWTRLFRQ